MEKDGTTLVMPDITKGCMLVTIYGSEIALIENFKSIIEYSDSIIKLQGKQKRLVIRGRTVYAISVMDIHVCHMQPYRSMIPILPWLFRS